MVTAHRLRTNTDIKCQQSKNTKESRTQATPYYIYITCTRYQVYTYVRRQKTHGNNLISQKEAFTRALSLRATPEVTRKNILSSASPLRGVRYSAINRKAGKRSPPLLELYGTAIASPFIFKPRSDVDERPTKKTPPCYTRETDEDT